MCCAVILVINLPSDQNNIFNFNAHFFLIIIITKRFKKNRLRSWDYDDDDNDNNDDDASNMALDDDTNDNENVTEPSSLNENDKSLQFSSLCMLGWTNEENKININSTIMIMMLF